MGMLCRWLWGLLIGCVLFGCGRAPEEPLDTGAKACVQAYYEALIQQDWSRAYAALDPQSQKGCSALLFNQLAKNYRSGLGFQPETVYIRAYEERSTEATAHVVLTGITAAQGHRYKDAITLRRGDDGWHVVLPPNFGRAKPR